MNELVVVSGKSVSAKTSLAASFAVLADRPVIMILFGNKL
jgi:MinD superfamily P-loop ATPase